MFRRSVKDPYDAIRMNAGFISDRNEIDIDLEDSRLIKSARLFDRSH